MSLIHRIEIDLTKSKDTIKIDGMTIGVTNFSIEYDVRHVVPKVIFSIRPKDLCVVADTTCETWILPDDPSKIEGYDPTAPYQFLSVQDGKYKLVTGKQE